MIALSHTGDADVWHLLGQQLTSTSSAQLENAEPLWVGRLVSQWWNWPAQPARHELPKPPMKAASHLVKTKYVRGSASRSHEQ